MKVRDPRWPSSWAFELRTREAGFLARVTNISVSGLRFDGYVGARPGQIVKFKVLGDVITGRVIRISMDGGAVAFRKKLSNRELSTMRQCRGFHDL
ncbi:PilZ domain-containing protein [uncultured Pelagimonas sp.]|uniref:PilZ domain-containing protein n=1 Tax=uncultured Pelagimonas sp. TaxID=1618102 RepID=UPI002627B944|nr:PilZ domain-containing protein [uncultured Pelagimonas sp.]